MYTKVYIYTATYGDTNMIRSSTICYSGHKKLLRYTTGINILSVTLLKWQYIILITGYGVHAYITRQYRFVCHGIRNKHGVQAEMHTKKIKRFHLSHTSVRSNNLHVPEFGTNCGLFAIGARFSPASGKFGQFTAGLFFKHLVACLMFDRPHMCWHGHTM